MEYREEFFPSLTSERFNDAPMTEAAIQTRIRLGTAHWARCALCDPEPSPTMHLYPAIHRTRESTAVVVQCCCWEHYSVARRREERSRAAIRRRSRREQQQPQQSVVDDAVTVVPSLSYSQIGGGIIDREDIILPVVRPPLQSA